MNVFNSLGSNYNENFVFQSLFAKNKTLYKSKLKGFLESKYNGEATLLHKGREALELALQISNLPKDSCVAINGFTCFAVYKAIVNSGYKVDYVDISTNDLNFTPTSLQKKLKENPKIKAVIIQNTLGYPCQIKEINEICIKNNLILIEDLAHSVGAKYESGKEAGNIGDFSILSFSQDKMIDAVSGGALIIRNKKYKTHSENYVSLSSSQQFKDRFYPLFTYFIRKTYSVGIGKILHKLLIKINLLSKPLDNKLPDKIFELAPWYCGLATIGFNKLEANIKHRTKIALIYAELLNKKVLIHKTLNKSALPSNLRFPILVENRTSLINFLKENNIYVSDIWYDSPLAPKKYAGQTSYQHQCPKAEKISEEMINLPTHINVTEQQARIISEKINQWLK